MAKNKKNKQKKQKLSEPAGYARGIPEFSHKLGVFYLAPDFIEGKVLTLNLKFTLNEVSADLDERIAQDLHAIQERWPERDVVLFGWDPDASKLPCVGKVMESLGVKTMSMAPHIFWLTVFAMCRRGQAK